MQFPKCDETPLGIYPVVDRANKLQPLYECGITTAQLRVKDMKGKVLESEIVRAIEISEAFGVRLFINTIGNWLLSTMPMVSIWDRRIYKRLI